MGEVVIEFSVMGLLSKVKSAVGLLANKGSALGAFLRPAANVALKGAKLGGKVLFGSKIATAVTLGTVAYSAGKFIKRKIQGRKGPSISTVTGAAVVGGATKAAILKSTPKGIVDKLKGYAGTAIAIAKKHPVAIAGAIATASAVGYGISKFRKRRKKAKSSKRRKKRRRKPLRTGRRTSRRTRSRSGKRVSFTTKDGRHVSFTPRGKKRAHRGRLTRKEVQDIGRYIRRQEND